MPETYEAAPILQLPSDALVRLLEDPESSLFQKAKACQRLAVVGEAEAAPALGKLLDDPRLSHYARTALEAMPDPEAGEALREALVRLRGDLLIGVINSLGLRRDRKALPMLGKLRHSHNLEVSRAASAALSRIRRP
ncbi:MAG: hypothetical protein GC160_11095 [Acidobacteria bacterium]|nr:hypothetical protein [Acidobacteriota bacterium]